MAFQILHNYEQGKGLEFADSKLNIKPDNSGNVQFEVSENGLKGNVELPAPFDASTIEQKLQQAEAKAQELQTALDAEKAKVTALEGKVQALETREDIHVTNAEVVEDTKLKLSIQGSEAVTVDLAKFLNVVPTSEQVYADIKADILRDVKAELQGEEIQDFSGSRKGYLLKA